MAAERIASPPVFAVPDGVGWVDRTLPRPLLGPMRLRGHDGSGHGRAFLRELHLERHRFTRADVLGGDTVVRCQRWVVEQHDHVVVQLCGGGIRAEVEPDRPLTHRVDHLFRLHQRKADHGEAGTRCQRRAASQIDNGTVGRCQSKEKRGRRAPSRSGTEDGVQVSKIPRDTSFLFAKNFCVTAAVLLMVAIGLISGEIRLISGTIGLLTVPVSSA